MIEIHGLTTHQCELLEIIWSIESMAEAEEWISTLDIADQQQCRSLIELINIELLDAKIRMSVKFPEATKLIKRIRSL